MKKSYCSYFLGISELLIKVASANYLNTASPRCITCHACCRLIGFSRVGWDFSTFFFILLIWAEKAKQTWLGPGWQRRKSLFSPVSIYSLQVKEKDVGTLNLCPPPPPLHSPIRIPGKNVYIHREYHVRHFKESFQYDRDNLHSRLIINDILHRFLNFSLSSVW